MLKRYEILHARLYNPDTGHWDELPPAFAGVAHTVVKAEEMPYLREMAQYYVIDVAPELEAALIDALASDSVIYAEEWQADA